MSEEASTQAIERPLILVVDDDPEVVRMLQGGLGARGYRVATATDGRRGLDMVRQEMPRLIVLDYWMPIVDGAAFMIELRDLLPSSRPPVILFTAVHDKPDLARQIGVDVYVEKPIQLSRFMRLVEAMLRGSKEVAAVTPAGQERRTQPRLHLRCAAEVRLPGQHGFTPGFIVDVSEGGLGVELSEPLGVPVDTEVGVTVESEPGKKVVLDARLCHARDRRIGLQFLPLDAARAEAVRAMLLAARALEPRA